MSFTEEYGLEKVSKLMGFLGNPQEKVQIIHVAGTSGKTSTCYYISAMLEKAGLKTGLSVSPEIDSVAERVQINGVNIADDLFLKYLNQFIGLVDTSQVKTSYWELMTAFAYWIFANKEKVDIAVIETGLGGLLDASNTIQDPSKICVITDIGLDHQAILGNTLPEIAAQKAGIIQGGNQVFVYSQSAEVNEVFVKKAVEKNAQITVLDFIKTLEIKPSYINDLPDYQKRNWLLARFVVKDYLNKNGIKILNKNLKASAKTYIPARMDISSIGDITVIMDGAHNVQKMTAFVEGFIKQYPGKKAPVLVAFKHNKDYDEVLSILKPIVSVLLITEFRLKSGKFNLAESAELLAKIAKNIGYTNFIVDPEPRSAFKRALNCKPNMLVVTGSFYLIGQLRRELK